MTLIPYGGAPSSGSLSPKGNVDGPSSRWCSGVCDMATCWVWETYIPTGGAGVDAEAFSPTSRGP